jgi:hypothetical protein
MRISIWRQFAGNHSADFAIVGTFETAEWAATVAEELRAMLRAVGAWRAQFDGDPDALDDAKQELFDRDLMPPPEEAIKAQYQLDWNRLLDWVPDPEIADVAVFQHETMVVLQPPASTWNGPVPFDTIMEQLGGALAIICENRDSYLMMRLSCLAPDEATARRMLADVEYREGHRAGVSPHGLFWTEATITREGRRVTFDRLRLYQITALRVDEPAFRRSPQRNQVLRAAWHEKWLGVAQQIMSLLEHVRGYGCSDVEYSVSEIPY